MSTLDVPTSVRPTARRNAQLWHRAVAVARMHFADHFTLFVLPASIVASIFVINIIIWQWVPVSGRNSGGAGAVYVFVLAVAALAVTRALPFALGMGASRRSFLLGTLLTGAALAAGWTALLFVLQRVEKATGGWWLHGNFFWFDWFGRSTWPATVLLGLTSLAATFALGALLGACWVRWNRLFLVVAAPSLVLVGGAVLILVTAQRWWHHVGHWFAALTPLTTAGWCALLAVVATALLHPVLRRVRG